MINFRLCKCSWDFFVAYWLTIALILMGIGRIETGVGTDDPNSDISKQLLNHINGLKFFSNDETFIVWFSPEKFLHNYWVGFFNANIKGNIRNFTKYKVHYIGKATDQDIWRRLTGHAALQDILSLEFPFSFGSFRRMKAHSYF